MNRVLIAMLLTGLLNAVSQAQDKKGTGVAGAKDQQGQGHKTPAGNDEGNKSQEVEILFHNGSKVRVQIQTEKLEIASIYGRLTVPIQDVLAIEFGLHYPEGILPKIDGAVKNLNSEDFRAREAASKTLLNLGPHAYPAVLRATQGKDAEVTRRARDIVTKLKAKHAKKELKTSPDDRVITPTQTLVGRILTPTVKTRGEYFGEMEHKVANMRTLRAITRSGPEADLSVDAGKYANAGPWLDTEYQLDGKSIYRIAAKGMIDQWPQQPGQYMCGPNGQGNNVRMPGRGGNPFMPGAKIQLGGNDRMYGGALIGKIGEEGDPFFIGELCDLHSEAEGKLYLQIGPSPWGCPSAGNYDVKIVHKTE
jgi:hypothetical protein